MLSTRFLLLRTIRPSPIFLTKSIRTMSTTNQNSSKTAHMDVMKEIVLDHDNIRDLMERYKKASEKSERAAIVNTIIREVAIHGEAEEVSIYKAYEKHGSASSAEASRHSHQDIEEAFYKVDYTKIDNPQFDTHFTEAMRHFLDHAKEEEDQFLPSFVSKLSPEENDKLAKSFLMSRNLVPERPHPSAPNTGSVAQQLLGGWAKLHDKIIATVTGRQFVDLKHEHPASGSDSMTRSHATNPKDSLVPESIQKVAPKPLEEALPESIHPTGNDSTKRSHATNPNESIVPKGIQKIAPKSVEDALPESVHPTGAGKQKHNI